ncbi:hypothetical protein COJ27_25220 [Bacillus cereus]|uniref:Uncharacterized protein n=2 Tax=Bacillus cereus group TaxID=86661 RepID=A0A9X6VI27_BACCE|nr:hypothetical protein [Bacillus wiedmannii]OUB79742.1 hypothetical protein BK788_25750 [Bacillus thuringiensis serovar sinensis]PFB30014.1 hypothetical protein CN388_07570 [Bacillus cereus]OAK01390.1 hypothetical protein A6280_17040 [Bacillus wiedmannii]PEM43167.1 hypothetical protein CN611_30380 [Bacillus wiedmannii]
MGKQIKNKTFFFGREERLEPRIEAVRAFLYFKRNRKGMFLFLLINNKVNNAGFMFELKYILDKNTFMF